MPEECVTRHFTDDEFRCRCGAAACDAPTAPHDALLATLELVRYLYGGPVIITSGNRCAKHNASVGGEKHSEHVQDGGCMGADIRWSHLTSRQRYALLDAIRHAGITRVGVYKAHLHVGIGDKVGSGFPDCVVWTK
jgi:hypothetical protein